MLWYLHISENYKEKRLNKGKYCEKTTKKTEKKKNTERNKAVKIMWPR